MTGSDVCFSAKASLCLVFFLVLNLGCEKEEVRLAKRPRPVSTKILSKSPPPQAALSTASVGAWKTEKIGFEVGGRIEFVVEQNTLIDARISDADGNQILAGTPVARIDPERYRLQVASSTADVERAEQNLIAAKTEYSEELPAKIDAAKASLELAETEFARSTRLVAQKAGAQSDLDRDKANRDSAIAELKQLEAAVKSKKAEIESLRSAVMQAKQNLRDAERNLEDCTLYASFKGQAAEVLVVPGSIVDAGTPVVSLQMMDPIKVELEVSAQQSRLLQRTEVYPVYVTLPDGTTETHDGFLHQIDSIADPQTRTYTLTLLVINKQMRRSNNDDLAIANDVWRLDLKFIPGAAEGKCFVEENAIMEDSEGTFMWMITNATIESRVPKDKIVEVRKVRVTPLAAKVPYLGNLFFQEVEIDDKEFDPTRHLVVGKMTVPNGKADQWTGSRVEISSNNKWMLRPGDIVQVDLSGTSESRGYYVPLDAISRRNGESAIFILVKKEAETFCKRVVVNVVAQESTGRQTTSNSSLREIVPINDDPLEGVSYVVRGAHYLVDGEKVNEVAIPEAGR